MAGEVKLAGLRRDLERVLRTPEDCTPAQRQLVLDRLRRFCADYQDWREVCDNLYDGIHIADGTGRVLFINKAYTRTTGVRPEDCLGRKVQEIEEEGKFYKGSVTAEVLRRRERVNSVATLFRMGKQALVTGTPVFGEDGEIKLVVTNTRDFEGLKELEQHLLTDLTEKNKKASAELAYLRQQQAGNKRISYHSGAMRSVMELIGTVAATDVTILITGESGTGKELVANEIYQQSERRGKPFIKVNCAAIPAELLESELFGYEDGAFTGARKTGKAGMFELANTGVILLDEIGDMPLALQTKLLRVLQQRELMRIGGSKPMALDIRVIASTNKDLREEIRKGNFREDLFYRLNVVPIGLKPLRERREDIPHLAREFCKTFNKKYGKQAALSPESQEALTDYPWPGNIRELENLIERLVVTNTTGTITRSNIFSALGHNGAALQTEPGGLSLKAQVTAFERELVLQAVEAHGSIRKAAKALGVDHSTLIKKCKQYRVDQPE